MINILYYNDLSLAKNPIPFFGYIPNVETFWYENIPDIGTYFILFLSSLVFCRPQHLLELLEPSSHKLYGTDPVPKRKKNQIKKSE